MLIHQFFSNTFSSGSTVTDAVKGQCFHRATAHKYADCKHLPSRLKTLEKAYDNGFHATAIRA
jgi:hypothetical protein